jgi:hypothetical protein
MIVEMVPVKAGRPYGTMWFFFSGADSAETAKPGVNPAFALEEDVRSVVL